MQTYSPSKIVSTFVFIFALSFAAFSQVDVPRRTTAITYPLDDVVFVQFRGTTRYPRMKGEAKMKRTSRNGTEIELSVSKMPRPFELGRGYATYVLWAVSPDGQVDNLGEIKRRGFFEFDSKISVTTPLQTFALIITAEPHFLVKSPSQEIMLENLTPYTQTGKKIDTMPSIQYFGNSSDFFRDSRTPEIAEIDYSKTPSTILQAKQAVALAKFAGAERDATEELREAETLLISAEESWKAGRDEENVDISARRAVSTAVKAESTALIRKQAREKRNEQQRTASEMQQIEDKYAAALAEIAELKAQLAGETRNRELSERDVANYINQVKELRGQNAKLSEDFGKARTEADNAKAQLSAMEQEKRTAESQAAREARLSNLTANEGTLVTSLKRYGTVAKSERGIVLTLPENFWTAPRSSIFAAAAVSKMAGLGELLANNPDYKIVIESHTDDRGTPEELGTLTTQRSQAVAERFGAFGIANGRVETKGLGATIPVAANTTAVNRAKNRRVHIILSPDLN